MPVWTCQPEISINKSKQQQKIEVKTKHTQATWFYFETPISQQEIIACLIVSLFESIVEADQRRHGQCERKKQIIKNCKTAAVVIHLYFS